MTTDFLFEDDLAESQQPLLRVLKGLPSRPRDMMNPQRVREGLNDVLALLNYERADAPVGIELGDEVDGRVVATRNGFDIIHLHLPRLRASVERPAVERVVRQHPHCMVVATSGDAADEGTWHFINVKDAGQGRKVLRRAVVEPAFIGRTVLDTLSQCRVDGGEAALDIQIAHERAFDVERVTDAFYADYKRVFNVLLADLEDQTDEASAHAFTHQLLNRLMFLYFVQRKRRKAPSGERIWWLNDDRDYVLNLWKQYSRAEAVKDTFYSGWLRPLLLMAFDHNFAFQTLDLPQQVKESLANLPYLNGGLFAETEADRLQLTVRDAYFEDIFRNLFERYNFTIREDTPLDVEVAVDPEMLGKVYESLVIQEERGQAGIFYTPRVELDFMCRRALIDYLSQATGVRKSALITLVINAPTGEGLPSLTPAERDQVLAALDNVTVVDPACGSGAFLVGMMEVLIGVLERLYAEKQQTFDRFQRKKEIISRNLYGVDIKEWAIRVAELRLWLSLVIETEEAGLDITRPLLPNLSFRLRAGDSLVEEIAGQQLALRAFRAGIGKRVQNMVRDLARKKAQYFRAEGEVSQNEIRRAEQALLRHLLEGRADRLSKNIARLKAGAEGTRAAKRLEGFEDASQPESTENGAATKTRARLEALQQEQGMIRALFSKGLATRPFLWEVDFAEVFYPLEDGAGGFDIVIGNPPYVRNEDIVPLDVPPDELTRETKQAYKAKLYDAAQLLWGNVPLDRSCDYYVYFYLTGLSLLKNGGVFCFINSNSWLDVEYGGALQEFLLQHMQVLDIYDNQARRTFKSADINTVIVVIRRPQDGADIPGHKARFVAFKQPFEDCLTAENIEAIEESETSASTDDYRVTVRSQSELHKEGVVAKPGKGRHPPSVAYKGAKWGGRYLRAPDIFFETINRAGDKLVRLGDIAHIDSGINTRANEFFYVKHVPEDEWRNVPIENFTGARIPRNCQVVRSNVGVSRTRNCEEPLTPTYWVIESKFLRPVLVSPQESPSILVDVGRLENLVLSVYDDWEELSETHVRAYIQHAMGSHVTVDRRTAKHVEGLQVNQRPELSRRKQNANDESRGGWWYAVRDKHYSQVLLPKITGDIFRTLYLDRSMPVDNNVYTVIETDQLDSIGLTLFLNSSLAILSRELYGRANLGQGALKTEGVDWAQLPCPRPKLLASLASDYGEYDTLFRRRIGAAWDEATQADKNRLDQVILRTLGVRISERLLAREAADLVRKRIDRAESFKAQQKTESRMKAVESLRGIWKGVPAELPEEAEPEGEG